jgi:hypothetical protein
VEDPSKFKEIQSLGPAAMRTHIMERIYLPPCFRTRVQIRTPERLNSTTTWESICSSVTYRMLDSRGESTQFCPESEDWVLVERNYCCVEVLRGSYPLLFSILCQLSPDALVNLTCTQQCLLCSTRRGRYRHAMVIHSMLEDSAPTSTFELISSVGWSPYLELLPSTVAQSSTQDLPDGQISEENETIQQAAAINKPALPQGDTDTSKVLKAVSWTQPVASSSGGSNRLQTPTVYERKKHAFYTEKARWVLKGFLRRRGIAFKRWIDTGDMIELLERHDVDHVDAAAADGFRGEDFD